MALESQAANLVFHQGFETCWVNALTEQGFRQAVETSIDGTTACIPSQSGSEQGIAYSICAISNGCGSGVNGCPVVLNAGAVTGSFITGQFTAPGTTNDIIAPVTTSLFGSCAISITNVVLQYQLNYLMQVDGTDGVYAEDMQQPLVDIASYTQNHNCNPILDGFIDSYTPQAIAEAETNAAIAIEPELRASTVEQAVCPVSGP